MVLYVPFFCACMVLFSLVCFLCQRRHVLIILLSLEAVILSLALLVCLSGSSFFSMDLFYCLVVLTFGACEASVALAVLVIVTRSFGRDMLFSLRLRKC